MVTTNRLISIEAFGSDPPELVHLTGFFQVLARVTLGAAPGARKLAAPAQLVLRFDAARVRGVGLKTGARYWVEGVHQSQHQPEEFSGPFDVMSHFELRRCAPDGSKPARLTLTVCFRVTVPGDGSVTVTAGDVEMR